MNSKIVAIGLIFVLGGMNINYATAEPPSKARAKQSESHTHDKRTLKGLDDEEREEMMRERKERWESMSEEERAEMMRERREEMRERKAEGSESDPSLSGSERAEEMRARRDERKAIKEEYRADREPGQERVAKDDETAGENQPAKAKKPWWKFWGD